MRDQTSLLAEIDRLQALQAAEIGRPDSFQRRARMRYRRFLLRRLFTQLDPETRAAIMDCDMPIESALS